MVKVTVPVIVPAMISVPVTELLAGTGVPTTIPVIVRLTLVNVEFRP